MPRYVIFLGMPRTASTSIQTYLSGLDQIHFLGKTGSEFTIDEMYLLLRRRIYLQNDEEFYQNYERGHLKSLIEAKIEVKHELVVISEEELSIGGVLNLGLHTVSFAETLRRLSYLMDDAAEFFMLFRRHSEFIHSFHGILASFGHFIPLDTFTRQIKATNTNIHYFMNYLDRLNELKEHPIAHVSTFENFIDEPVHNLHNKVLKQPIPENAKFPHDNLRPDKLNVLRHAHRLIDLHNNQSQPFPMSFLMTNFGFSQDFGLNIDVQKFYDLSDEMAAWVTELERQYYDPLFELLPILDELIPHQRDQA